MLFKREMSLRYLMVWVGIYKLVVYLLNRYEFSAMTNCVTNDILKLGESLDLG